jgi:ubiquinone/menaquinone biosynthesis C-methylase UbiE
VSAPNPKIIAFYDAAPEYEWQRLERHKIEYEMTLRALRQHLPAAPARLCDIGGGVGRYAIELTRQEYQVTLVDLSSKCTEFARRKAVEANVRLAEVLVRDARDLSPLPDSYFDAVLLMGPLYHLMQRDQQLQAVREAQRVLRAGGILIATFISRFAILHYAAVDAPDYVLRCREECDTILASGVYSPEGSGGFTHAYFAHPSEVRPLMEEAGLTTLDLLALEPLVHEQDEKMPLADDVLRARWIDVLWQIARDPSVIGSTGHLLYVGRKSQ